MTPSPCSCVRSLAASALCLWTAALVSTSLVTAASAQPKKDSAVLAMTLEPPGLDPTAGAASAIAEVVDRKSVV